MAGNARDSVTKVGASKLYAVSLAICPLLNIGASHSIICSILMDAGTTALSLERRCRSRQRMAVPRMSVADRNETFACICLRRLYL
jgi:hypothetical protein